MSDERKVAGKMPDHIARPDWYSKDAEKYHRKTHAPGGSGNRIMQGFDDGQRHAEARLLPLLDRVMKYLGGELTDGAPAVCELDAEIKRINGDIQQ